MMKNNTGFFLYFLLAVLSCMLLQCKPEENESPPIDPNLIFQSGFEGSSEVVVTGISQLEDIVGVDSTLPPPNDWTWDFDWHPNIGDFRLYFEGGSSLQRIAKITQDPVNPQNRALQFWLSESNVGAGEKGRIQADIYGNNGLKQIYQSVKVYFHPDFELLKTYPEQIFWLTIFEFWNDPGWDNQDYPFRISLNFEKPPGREPHDIHFRVHGQTKNKTNDGWTTLWEETNNQIPIPIGEWFTLEIYIREGDKANGQVQMTLTPDGKEKKTLFDIVNLTHHPDDPSPDGISHFNPMKLYTSNEILSFMKSNGKALQVFWDDFKLQKDR